ncbi:MAG: putative toxin-antitoxin system toxin component, PIN family [Puniceicoccales bacterium]
MEQAFRWVADTNVLVSHLLMPDSLPGRALRCAMKTGELLFSEETLNELAEVIYRPKFDRYLDDADRSEFFTALSRIAVRVAVFQLIAACRDPKDDKFLSLAVSGRADAIISGDRDLLELHPFMGVEVLTPKDFVQRYG